jgi:hypothetical protein
VPFDPEILLNGTTQENGPQRFCLQAIEFQAEMARPAGFEPTTPWFVAR